MNQMEENRFEGAHTAVHRVIYDAPEALAVTEDGMLTELIPRERTDETGAICMGRIHRMMPGMDCAFVDIGRRRDGFLPLTEGGKTFSPGDTLPSPSGQGAAIRPLRSGDLIPVQIRREETGEKGVFLSRDLSLAGSLVILMPMNRYIGVSKRITDAETFQRLRALGSDLAAGRFGLVLREAAAGHPGETSAEKESRKAEIREETEALLREWQALARSIRNASAPGVLRREDPLTQLIRDYEPKGLLEIRSVPALPEALQGQIRNAKGRKVSLPGGGNLVIDRCEAMTVIDVNSGSDHAGPSARGKRDTVLAVNLNACGEIVRQVRLRNLCGILLIDFIDMEREEDRAMVQERLAEAFRADRIKTVLHGWTRLGLMEMTRRRQGRELAAAPD